MTDKKDQEQQKSTNQAAAKPAKRASIFSLFLPNEVVQDILSPESRARLNEAEFKASEKKNVI